jgi:hypothetical protein
MSSKYCWVPESEAEKKLIMKFKLWLALHPNDNPCMHCIHSTPADRTKDCEKTIYYPIALGNIYMNLIVCLVFLYKGNYVK